MEHAWNKRRFFNERPMLWGILGTLLGALLAVRLGAALLWGLGLLTVGLGAFLLWRGKIVYALPLLLGLLLLRGAVLPGVRVVPGEYEVCGTLIDDPEREKGETRAVLGRVTLDGRRVPGALALRIPYDAALAYGDALSLRAQVAPEEGGAAVGLSTVLYGAEARGSIRVSEGRADPLYGWALFCRQRLEAAADALFSDQAGPAKGMLFGDKDDIHYLTFRAYQRSGLLHLLTVSGLHVGVVCGAALQLIRGRRKWLRFGVSLAVVGLFCLLTGLSPSSLRAAIMLLIVRFSHLLDRQDDPISQIGFALWALLMVNPYLLTSTGFCLSFGSVWSLACLTKPLLALLGGRRESLRGLLAGSLSVCLGIAPLLSRADGAVSLMGVPLSLLALPAAPLFLIPGWIAVLLYLVFPGAARVVALLPQGVLYYLDALSRLAPVSGLTVPAAGGVALGLWFTGMLFVSEYFLPNGRRPAYLGWGLLMAGALVWFLA